MARFVALFLLAAVVCAVYAFPDGDAARRCGRNEYFDACGTSCEPTCQDPNPSICTMECRIGCQCRQGFVRRTEGGECIPRHQCRWRN